MSKARDGKSLSLTTLIAYGLPALPLSAILLPVYIYLPTYYAINMGLGFAVVGGIRFFSGIWDVITDPLIGLLSDKSQNRFGRRKIYILLGCPVTMLGTWMLLSPSGEVGALYMAIWSCVMYTGWTMMMLPLTAMSTEISSDYDERSRIAGVREAFTTLGTLAVLVTVTYLGISEHDDTTEAVHAIAKFVCIMLPVCTALFFWRVPDPQRKVEKKLGFKTGLKILRQNEPFRKLIGCYFLNAFANGLPAILILLFVQNVIGRDEPVGPYLLGYFLSGILCLPVWIWLASKIGKHKSWCIAMCWACASFSLVPLVGQGDTLLFLAICVATGAAVGADLALPSSIQADVVDIDYAKTHKRRAGLYFALWGMATKLSLAIAAGLAFPILEWSGFPNRDNDIVMLFLYAGLPIAIKAFLAWRMWSFPLDEDCLKQVQNDHPERCLAKTA